MFDKKLIALAALAGALYSCGTPADEDAELVTATPDTIKTSVLNVGGELFSVPSPIQTAMLVQKVGLSYDKSMLLATNKVNTFNTDDAKALNLGVYGADLAYVSLHSQSQDALGYLASIKQLSDQLGITAAFDSATMKRISENITNKDSMMTLVGLAYRASDAYLKNNQRDGIGGLILTGGWIESMHFSLQAYKEKPSQQVQYRIAEQKQALNSIVKMLSSQESEEVKQLHSMLNDLLTTYDQITFRYIYEEPRTDTANKVTYINSSTEITVSDQQISEIGKQIGAIRTKITTNQSQGG